MKKLLLCLFLLGLTLIIDAQPAKMPVSCNPAVNINTGFSRATRLDSVLKKYAPGVVPGVSLAVFSESEGWWASAAGYANIEKKQPMDICHLQYLQSVSKMFAAVELLQLKEQGKAKLDDAITKYLPVKYSRHIKNAKDITIRMLLNHTSGIAEYNTVPEFLSKVILQPTKDFSAEDCLEAINRQPQQFAPGTKYAYTNTNYLLITLIEDAITGDHAAFIRKHIFQPLNMKNSFYDKGVQYLNGLNLPESYWDLLNNGIPVNITPFQQMTVRCSKGDDGIVCTTTDAILFLKGLMEGRLLNAASMTEMMTFVTDEKGNKRYGLGVTYLELGGSVAYGHGGGGVGAGCGLVYIPSHKMYLFFAINLGVFIEGTLTARADNMKNEILMALLQ